MDKLTVPKIDLSNIHLILCEAANCYGQCDNCMFNKPSKELDDWLKAMPLNEKILPRKSVDSTP